MENIPLKKQRRHQTRQKRRRSETIEKIWLEREVQNLEEPLNALVAISMASTVGSC
jgi:serine/threonine-protein kinase RIO1